MGTGPCNTGDDRDDETYRNNIRDGAIAWGCYSIKPRRKVCNFLVGAYKTEHYDGNIIKFDDSKYFAMCNHGVQFGPSNTRKMSIDICRKSFDYCDECAILHLEYNSR